MAEEELLDLYLEKRMLYEEMRSKPNRKQIKREYQGLVAILYPRLQDKTMYRGYVIKKGMVNNVPVLMLYTESSWRNAQNYHQQRQAYLDADT